MNQNPKPFVDLLKNRQNSICVNKAIYSSNNDEIEFSVDDMLSGITKNIDRHMNVLTKPKIKVKTIKLDDLLRECNAPKFIDYLSLDTEGSEFEILKSINFDEYKFGMIHVEHNFIEPRRTQMREFLLSKGYKYNRENKFDDEYVFSDN